MDRTLWVAGPSFFIPSAVLHFNATVAKHLQIRLAQVVLRSSLF